MKIIGIYPIKASEPVYMVEAFLENLSGQFDFTSITQENPDEPKDNWQVPYMEHLLSEDGSKVLANDIELMSKPELLQGNVRMAFFFHYLNLNKPLKTPWGNISLPEETEKPQRITIEYEEP